ncbi:kinase-like domain-containing protein [Halteromyces radiatus]|uniref:kinase-like domain-containing protein n=1 Tax=Halteromyces radiatus TaxID=101107 RepID=UPI002220E42A|nr:kinase-like domain-containing protein [Halteromyces radiatus]KAI8097671.1 kinase-like domain-containing protein [Halteromyces radiatus]
MIDIIRNLFKNKKSAKLTIEEAEEANAAATKFLQEQTSRKSKLPIYKGLERFELLSKVGDGAFSNVFKARDKETGQIVAIKIAQKHELNDKNNTHLHPSLKKRTKATERANILKEVQIMRGVNHPNIVKLNHFSESDDYYFLVLELCEGGELFHQIVKLTYFSEDLARHVIYQVASAVRYLHEECGVVHRDIKPENILIEPIPIIPSKKPKVVFIEEDKVDEGEFIHGKGGGGIGNVKLADFGLSKVIWDTDTLTPCGTVGYTAPEVVTDQRYSKSVDLWSLGVLLYTMLCGFPPFYDESIRSLTTKVMKGQYTFLSPWWDPISKSAKDLVSHLLCVDPNERYTIDQFFAHPWMQQYQGKKDTKLHRMKDPRTQAMQNAAVAAQRTLPTTTVTTTATTTTTDNIGSSSHPLDPTLVDQEDKNERSVKMNENEEQEAQDEIKPLPSAANNTKRQDLFTPGFASLKEILDITYAVQRMGEESPQLRDSDEWTEEDNEEESDIEDQQLITLEAKQSISSDTSSTTHSGSVPATEGLSEEIMAKAEQLAISGKGFAHVPTTTKDNSVKKQHHLSTPTSHRRKHVFKLNMDQATLLRNRRAGTPVIPDAA